MTNKYLSFSQLCIAILALISIESCMQAEPARKKLPVLLSDGIEGNYAFKTKSLSHSEFSNSLTFGNTELMMNGTMQSFVTISLPDPESDLEVLNLATLYKPFATTLLTEWAKQNKTGVVVDFRSNPLFKAGRADFIVERKADFAFPLVFLWDDLSINRAAGFMALINDVSGINCRKLN